MTVMKNMSKEYALALFMLAKEENKEHEYFEALGIISEVFKDNPEYIDFLSSPRINKKERMAAVKAAFAEHIPDNVISFILLLSEEGQIDNFDDCNEEYRILMLRDNHISEAKVRSAVELSDEEKDKLHEKLEKISGHPVIMEYEVDSGLLGGMIVDLDGKVMDGSLRSRLKGMKEVMEK